MVARLGELERTDDEASGIRRHTRWVRVFHWIGAVSVLTLAFSGYVILMAHPRLYWGYAGNDLTPSLIELPISRNYEHHGYERPTRFYATAGSPVSANRTYDIFNENGWARSLHFLAAWFMVIPGAAYLLIGLSSGHFRRNVWPRARELAPHLVWRDIVDHLHPRSRTSSDTAVAHYGLLQKCAYSLVLFVALPVMVAAGLAMSPAVAAFCPPLLSLFGGYQSARTIHFVVFVALVLFVVVHLAMVVLTGFSRQIRAMTVGE